MPQWAVIDSGGYHGSVIEAPNTLAAVALYLRRRGAASPPEAIPEGFTVKRITEMRPTR